MWNIKIVEHSSSSYFIMFDYNGVTKFTMDNQPDGTSIVRSADGEKVAKITSEDFNNVDIKKFTKKKY